MAMACLSDEQRLYQEHNEYAAQLDLLFVLMTTKQASANPKSFLHWSVGSLKLNIILANRL